MENDELNELDEVELDDETAVELPEREALSLVDLGDTLGPPPRAE